MIPVSGRLIVVLFAQVGQLAKDAGVERAVL